MSFAIIRRLSYLKLIRERDASHVIVINLQQPAKFTHFARWYLPATVIRKFKFKLNERFSLRVPQSDLRNWTDRENPKEGHRHMVS